MPKDRRTFGCESPLVTASLVLLLVGCDSGAASADDSNAGSGGTTTSVDGADGQGEGGTGCVLSDGSVGVDAASADGSPGSAGECQANLPGPALVNVPAPQGCTYCMDSTEVTNAHYAAFLAAKGGDITGQDERCEWNTSYESKPSLGDDYPVEVDWCDAFAYCKWAGKRLCGKIGGGATLSDDRSNARVSEWYNACSRGGTRIHSVGEWAGECNAGSSGPLPVSARQPCEGGYPGLFDLSGNVEEWADSCGLALSNSRADDSCITRGGSWFALSSNHVVFATACNSVAGEYRSFIGPGIRCCVSSI